MAQDYSKILEIISGVSERILNDDAGIPSTMEYFYDHLRLSYEHIGVMLVQKAISEAFERGELV